MFVSHVDAGLEKLLRVRLPLAETVGDVSFDTPNREWSAALSRITVNLFLYDLSRSNQPSRSPVTRAVAAGEAAVKRRPQPMMQLTYLVSVWAGSARDEHLLLGDVASVLAGAETIPPELLSSEVSSGVQLLMGDERTAAHQIWTATGGNLRPSLALRAVVAADTFAWELEAPAVTRIAAMAERMDNSPPDL